MKNKGCLFFILLLAFSVAFNLYLGLKQLPVRMGGGQQRDSPDEQYTAFAQSYTDDNPLSSDHGKIWGELSIAKRSQDGLHTGPDVIFAAVKPSGVEYETAYRDLDGLITWSDDSSTVTFDLPHVSIGLTLKKQPVESVRPLDE